MVMNRVIYVSFFILLTTLGCNKDLTSDIQPGNPDAKILPFENDNIKMELITSSAPGNTRDIHFFDAAKAIAATYNSEIYLTIDSGKTWTLQYKNAIKDQPLFQILFTDPNTGYVVGGDNSTGLILKTTDGGISWTNIYQTKKAEIVSISRNSSGDLFIISNGAKGWISRSTNNGASWTFIDSTAYHLSKIIFNDNFGFCTGAKGNIIRSNDNGNTWKLITTLDALYVTDIKFIDGSGYCMANNLSVYKTNDNGTSWAQTFHSEMIFYGLIPLTGNNCLIYGSGGYTGGCFGIDYGGIGQTTNSGFSWSVIPLTEVPSIICTSFYSSKEGYAIGGYGMGYLIKVNVK